MDGKKKRKHKHKKHKSKSQRKHRDKEPPSGEPKLPHQETEEEYDARLEREENERLEAERKDELAGLREKLKREQEERERENRASGRINYKGKFLYPPLSTMFDDFLQDVVE